MKALTLIQPWSWAIAHAGKRVENRMWSPPRELIGHRIAIHAGKKLDDAARLWLADEADKTPPCNGGYVLGAVESVATLVDVVALAGRSVRHWGKLSDDDLSEVIDSVWFQGPVGWVLGDVIALPRPVPCRGAQKLWTAPADIEADINRQIEERNG